MKEIDKKFDKIRCNLYIPSEIVEEVDAMSKTYGASRSVMVSFLMVYGGRVVQAEMEVKASLFTALLLPVDEMPAEV